MSTQDRLDLIEGRMARLEREIETARSLAREKANRVSEHMGSTKNLLRYEYPRRPPQQANILLAYTQTIAELIERWQADAAERQRIENGEGTE